MKLDIYLKKKDLSNIKIISSIMDAGDLSII